MSIPGAASPLFLATTEGAAPDFEIPRSLRFNYVDSAYLNRTPSSASNRKTWTWSGWVKCTDLVAQTFILAAGSSPYFQFYFSSTVLYIELSGAYLATAQVFRDPSAFYHFVLAFDTTQATAANRVKLYVNGSEVTTWTTDQRSSIAQNTDTAINSATQHNIGKQSVAAAYSNMMLAEVNFIDGQALAGTDFGETDSSGVWRPKEYAGSYGPAVDQSQTWSSGMKTTTTANTSYSTSGRTTTFPDSLAATNPFDADLTNFLYSQTGAAGTWLYVEFGTALANVTSIVFSTEYSCPGGVIKLNGTNVAVNQSNLGGGFVEASVTGTIPASLTEIAIQGNGGSARLKYLKINGKYLLDSGVSLSSNGYHLAFADNSNATAATLGKDTSGNANNFTPTNFSVAAGVNNDSFVDSPTNGTASSGGDPGGSIVGNYATLNPLEAGGYATTSNGNLNQVGGSTDYSGKRANFSMASGKWYWEVTITATNGYAPGPGIQATNVKNYESPVITRCSYYNSGHKFNGTLVSYGASFATNDVIGVAFDADAGSLTFYKNGASQGVAFSSLANGPYSPLTADYNGSGTSHNFGQRAFSNAAPAGYKSLNTANLPTPTIADSSTAMDVVRYNGNGSTQAISGMNMSPDLVWTKYRSGAIANLLYDTVRGVGPLKGLNSDQTRIEGACFDATGGSGYGYVSAFNSDGHTVVNGGQSASYVNYNGHSYISWVWNAGANSDKTYAITVANPGSGNKYYADSALQPTLTLAEGSTYKFDQSAATNSGHPLRFSTTSDGTHGGGSEYTTGVTTAGTPGSAGAFTQIVIAASAPTLYVYCTAHSGMGFQVNTSDTAGSTIPAGSISSAITNSAQTWSSNITTTGNSGSWWPSYPATYIFDANTSNYGHANGNGSVAAVVTLSFSPAVTCVSTVSFFGGLTGSGAGTISINGGTAFNLTTGSSATTKTTVAFSGSISSIVVTKTATGGEGLLCYGFEIDGVRLTDNTGWSFPASPSIASQVKASPENGFSIVSYDYPASGSFTVGHGLNSAPAVIIYKNRNRATSWFVYHSAATSKDQYMILNGNSGVASGSNFWGTSAPTNAVFGSTVDVTGISTDEAIAYCFTPVAGHSAMGKYTGNQNASGPFVYTGFKVSWLMVKRSDGGGSGYDWFIWDDQRDSFNAVTQDLRANDYAAETVTTRCDFLSNGFKIRGANLDFNASNGVYIWMAFASNPFASNGGLAR